MVTENGNLTFETGGTINSNTAEWNGGGIWCNGTCKMSAGTVGSNTAENYGGGLYIASSGSFTLSGGTIKNNEADGGKGNGIYKTSKGTYKKSNSPSCTGNNQSGLTSACEWSAN